MKLKSYVFGILFAGAGACIFSLDASQVAQLTAFEMAESILKKEFFELKDKIAPYFSAAEADKTAKNVEIFYYGIMSKLHPETLGTQAKELLEQLTLLKNKTDSFNALKALHDADIATKLDQVKNLFANIQLSPEQVQKVTDVINQVAPKNAIANEVKVLTSPQAAGWFSKAKGTAGGVISGLWQKIPSISQIKQSAKDHKLLAAAGGIAIVGLLTYGGYCYMQPAKATEGTPKARMQQLSAIAKPSTWTRLKNWFAGKKNQATTSSEYITGQED